MYLNILMLYGFLGLLCVFSFCAKTDTNNIKFAYFPIIIIVFLLYICFSCFQYIDVSDMSYWTEKNDLVRYKINYDRAINFSLRNYYLYNQQEPLYTLLVFLFRRITPYFSFFLVFIYVFNLFCFIKFIQTFITRYNFASLISAYSIYYTFFLQTYCLLRMGIAVSFSLLVYCSLSEKKMKQSVVLSIVSSLFHISSIYLLLLIMYYCFFNKHKRYFVLESIVLFFIGLIALKIVTKILPLFSNRYLHYLNLKSALALRTYITYFIFLIFMILKKQKFLERKGGDIFFVTMMSILYIFALQTVVSIFYRMIFFTYPALMFSSLWVFEIDKINKRNFFLSLMAKIYAILFWIMKVYQFCTNLWFDTGLDIYKLFYIN